VPDGDLAVALSERGVTEAIMGGRRMRGWVRVEAGAVVKKADLRRWVNRGVTAARGYKERKR
jgi:hypothetical protein